MARYTLLLLEVSGIQKYIFGSNHLPQNIGGSELVARSTSHWVDEILKKLELKTNVSWREETGLAYSGENLIDHRLDVEVIYEGGGNVMILFRDDNPAKAFVREITRRSLIEAPGLQLIACRKEFDWETEVLAEVHSQLRTDLASRKSNRPASVPLVGLGVTAKCVFTGLPAIGFDDDPTVVGEKYAQHMKERKEEAKRISGEVAAKLKANVTGRERLHKILPQVRQNKFEFAYIFNDFGTKGESSYIAVVHTDGNSMGNRFKNIGDTHNTPQKNAGYIQALRNFSNSVKKNADKALKDTVNYLLDSLQDSTDGKKKFGGIIPIPYFKKQKLLPFQPIVFGGDDVTFVTEGRLGLTLALKYLQTFAQEKLSDEKPAFARAGIAVVKSHFPFSRAYDLAEELAASAKKSIPNRKLNGELSVNVMDWHFSTTGLVSGLEEIRRREYQNSKLLMRPLRIDNDNIPESIWQTWKNFASVMYEFQREDEKGQWAGRRNKIKALRDALRKGKDAVKLFRENFNIEKLPEIPGQPDMWTTGWQGEECGYFDAIEALDFYVSLDKSQEGQ